MAAIYEATLIGCSDETPETDGLVVWIKAEAKEEAHALLDSISALVDGELVETSHNPRTISDDAIDLVVGLSTTEDVFHCVSGAYAFLDGLYLSDYNLTEELTANHVSTLCDQYVQSMEGVAL